MKMANFARDNGFQERAYYPVSAENNEIPVEPIAIVGMAMRLPGRVHTEAEFWKMLVEKRSGLCDVPKDRFNVASFHDPAGRPGTFKVDKAYFLEDIDIRQFDTSMFPLSKSELEWLDPQQRQLLEVTYECMENSGATSWRGSKIGCYVGLYGEDWQDLNAKETQNRGSYRITGYGDFVLGNRVSYEYDLHGPSMTVKTACSSSLVCLNMACDAIRKGDCDGALVCGTSMIFSPTMMIALSDRGLLSPGGISKTFDVSADGYGRGEAVNAVYIRRLSQAIQDGDQIRAIIRGTSVNSDGRTNGMLTPSTNAQEALIRQTYQQAGIRDLSETAFVECHGTGTPVGDPLETTAVANAFGDKGMLITSVKPNVGHSEGAAGITSLIKAVLSIEHRQVPPNIHFKEPNPAIEVETWPQGRAERVSVNSFGIGGVNAHVVVESLEEYLKFNPSFRHAVTARDTLKQGNAIVAEEDMCEVQQLLLLSANSEVSLERSIEAHRAYLEQSAASMKDIAYTLANRRDHGIYRAFAAAAKFTGKLSFDVYGPMANESGPRVAWIFTGQGAQWPEMGAELIDSNLVFRKSIRELDAFLADLPKPPPWTIEGELRKSAEDSRVSQAEFGHPLSIAVQIGLINVLRVWGIQPDFVLGHSSGEMAAAYASGAVTATAAMAAATFRGIGTTDETAAAGPRGSMAAIGLGAHEMDGYMESGVVIACENSQCSVTVSGDTEQVARVVENVKSSRPGVLARFLHVEKAFHSHHMKEYGASYENHLTPFIKSVDPVVPFYSSVTGQKLTGDGALGPQYWRQNMESPVLFNTALRSALNDHQDKRLVLIEIGPHPALRGPIGQILRDIGRNEVTQIGTLQRNKISSDSINETAGNLFLQQVELDTSVVCPPGKLLTSLPNYQWKRDVSHWAESRLAKEFRFREFAPHDLLGIRVVEVSNENCWRNKLALDDSPWLQGHQVDGEIVFPGAGYICMVGEAIRQISGEATYSLTNVNITSGLILEYSKVAELVTRLTSISTESDEAPVYSFQITSYDGSRWIKHCAGEVRPGVDKSVNVKTTTPGPLPRSVDPKEWYSALKRIGFNYQGPFRGMRAISSSTVGHTAVAAVPTSKADRYSIHPSVIDQCFQLFSVAACRGLGRNCKNVAVPTFIEEMVVAPATQDLNVVANIHTLDRGSYVGDLSAESNGQLQLLLKGFKASAMTCTDSVDDNLPLISSVEWRPHADFIHMKDYMHPRTSVPQEWPMLEELMLLAILEHLETIVLKEETASHLLRLYQWMKEYVADYKAGNNVFLSKASEHETLNKAQRLRRIEKLAEELASSHYDAFAIGIHRLFKAAESIYAGETHALHILMQDAVLHRLYTNGNELLYGDAIHALGHTNPRLRVLEVGAGTGGTTSKVLEALTTQYGERLYSTYTYTDISAGFMAAAKERFATFTGIQYSTFDISKDPTEQGFSEGSYDLIIGYNVNITLPHVFVVHATPNLQQSLRHLRSLLSPHGRIFLQELCPTAKYINYIFGFLSGWWLGADDNRANEPYVAPERWCDELVRAGFKNPEFVLDGVTPYHQSAGIIATIDSKPIKPSRVTVLCHHPEGAYVTEVKASLSAQNIDVDIITFGQDLPAQDVISLLELQEHTVHELNEKSFEALVGQLQALDGKMLWAVRSSQIKCNDPRAAMSIGLARTARNEMSAKLFTLELESSDTTENITDAISELLLHIQNPESAVDSMDPDWEYALVDGKILVPRLHWQTMSSAFDSTERATQRDSFKYLTLKTPGLLHTIGWAEGTKEPLAKGQIRVQTKAVGLNFRDVLIALGVLENSTREIGLEGCGIVTEVGSDVSKLVPGDRVMYMSKGCFTTEIILEQTLCVKLDDSISLEQGAALPCVYATAIMALVDKANLRRGQTILIHSACGGVGLAAIQIAQMLGAEIYCTVSNEEKITYLVDNFGISAANIFNSRDSSFLRDIMQATGGQGVDVVLNSLSGDLLHASWKCVAEFGIMIEIGKRDFRRRSKLCMDAFEQNRTFIGLDLWKLSQVRPQQAADLLERFMTWIREGKLNAGVIAKTFEASQVQEAFRFMQGGKHIGKIIVTMPEDTSSLQAVKTRPGPALRSDRSYVLVGGLGGLGRALATWMAENGAGELIFLSRSANPGPQLDGFAKEIASHGCSVQLVPGSVVDMNDVKRTIQSASKPIAGIINLSMILRDVTLKDMSFQDWTTVVEPKVQGTWNLHNAIDTELDFFILCSSFSGIVGQVGQANYAAANTFLDSFVQYRHSKGLAASVIDIGIMGEVGFVSKHKNVLDLFQKSGMRILKEQDLLDAFHLAIQRSAPTGSQARNGAYYNPGQIMLGLVTTIPVASPDNRVVWKNDIRMSIYHNMNCAEDSITKDTIGQDAVSGLIAAASASPSVLEDPETTDIITKAIASSLAKFLIKDEDSIKVELSPEKNGIDSLVAMELRNWIRQMFGVEASVMIIIQSPSIIGLAGHIRQGLIERFAQT
ncbi:LOW QUALITY PROTEIN: Highly reducing polyketide synthase lcsB [Paramyrothecium foliicola]|nr:LOW QUALITY PROTEIN: Highly reducing polyketide synthase lcsB [Paramyrothecium foliicola]